MHEQAIEHLHQALDLAEHHQDPIHQVYVHHSIAWAWIRQKNYSRALEHARRGLDLVRPLDESVWEARMLNTMGWCAAQLNEYNTGWAHCQAALALQREHHDSDEADTLDSLGYIAHHTGQHAHAVDYDRQALAVYRDRGNTYDEAGSLVRLGQNYAALGDEEQARAAWRQALELYQEQGRSGDAGRVQRQLDDLDNPGGAAVPRT
jgi:tetratricopeptide (TPR) repeat protein